MSVTKQSKNILHTFEIAVVGQVIISQSVDDQLPPCFRVCLQMDWLSDWGFMYQ